MTLVVYISIKDKGIKYYTDLMAKLMLLQVIPINVTYILYKDKYIFLGDLYKGTLEDARTTGIFFIASMLYYFFNKDITIFRKIIYVGVLFF
ncbi:hypothetical protein Calkro_0369 [Caldicellulosiruptor kronotskyensis 2002]|uniref:Uncharacterized protein n=1 Tax=Caldicellulosiruptor kronotskyensis (strain DSM 18902 / VKM B-2412 / 2002) TaxID=632348 RepID=E4SDY5_CALK2|nr:hypothetical protein [Caldicellulosiruptor kronotskyensis]ADQ45272.1 hypothetical protein Calkro_0369 [Caldicellulosiruptor kronotskyensis 2002]